MSNDTLSKRTQIDVADTIDTLVYLEERVLQRSGNLNAEQTEQRMNRAVQLLCAVRLQRELAAIDTRLDNLNNSRLER